MKIKQILKTGIVALCLMASLTFMFVQSPVASAACDPKTQSCCGGVETSIISCPQGGGSKTENTGVWGLLVLVMGILTAGVGVLAVAGIVYGSILYTSAGDSAEKVTKARGVIRNVVIGIIAYALMYAGLNFIIPGGLFT